MTLTVFDRAYNDYRLRNNWGTLGMLVNKKQMDRIGLFDVINAYDFEKLCPAFINNPTCHFSLLAITFRGFYLRRQQSDQKQPLRNKLT